MVGNNASHRRADLFRFAAADHAESLLSLLFCNLPSDVEDIHEEGDGVTSEAGKLYGVFGSVIRFDIGILERTL